MQYNSACHLLIFLVRIVRVNPTRLGRLVDRALLGNLALPPLPLPAAVDEVGGPAAAAAAEDRHQERGNLHSEHRQMLDISLRISWSPWRLSRSPAGCLRRFPCSHRPNP